MTIKEQIMTLFAPGDKMEAWDIYESLFDYYKVTNNNVVRNALSNLVSDGELERPEMGLYRRPENDQEA